MRRGEFTTVKLRRAISAVLPAPNKRLNVLFTADVTGGEVLQKTSETRANGSVWELALWPDEKQTYLMNADGANNEVRTLLRDTGEIVGRFGRNGRMAGDFHWVHNIAVDSKGNVFTTEVDTGKRAQKFIYRGDALPRTRPAAQ